MDSKFPITSKTVRRPTRPLTKVSNSKKPLFSKSSTITSRTQATPNPESSLNSPKLQETLVPTPNPVDPNPVLSSSDLLKTLKSTLQTLQEESKNYQNSVRTSKNLKFSETRSKETLTWPDTLDSELRSSSFSSKTLDSTPSLSDLQSTIKTLNAKIHDSEKKVQKSTQDSKKLKEVVQEIEQKLEKRKIFHEKIRSAPCGTNCQII